MFSQLAKRSTMWTDRQKNSKQPRNRRMWPDKCQKRSHLTKHHMLTGTRWLKRSHWVCIVFGRRPVRLLTGTPTTVTMSFLCRTGFTATDRRSHCYMFRSLDDHHQGGKRITLYRAEFCMSFYAQSWFESNPPSTE
jgi:hypothetical protein